MNDGLDNEYGPTYRTALTKAGANILAYGEFGSYSGDWFAKVEFDGETFWLHDYFGSCSGCDALQADLDYEDATDEKLAAFGAGYLADGRITHAQALEAASEHVAYDQDSEEMVAFVRDNA